MPIRPPPSAPGIRFRLLAAAVLAAAIALGGLSASADATDAPLVASALVAGGHVYRGDAIPALVGRYVFAGFCGGTVFQLVEAAPGVFHGSVLLQTTAPHLIASFGEDEDGELYYTDLRMTNGKVYRIVPA